MSKELKIEAVERDIAALKRKIEFGKRQRRLLENLDFKAVILDDFCLTDAARNVQQSVNPNLKQHEREACLSMAQASGHLKTYLQFNDAEYRQAVDELPRQEAELDRLRGLSDEEFADEWEG